MEGTLQIYQLLFFWRKHDTVNVIRPWKVVKCPVHFFRGPWSVSDNLYRSLQCGKTHANSF